MGIKRLKIVLIYINIIGGNSPLHQSQEVNLQTSCEVAERLGLNRPVEVHIAGANGRYIPKSDQFFLIDPENKMFPVDQCEVFIDGEPVSVRELIGGRSSENLSLAQNLQLRGDGHETQLCMEGDGRFFLNGKALRMRQDTVPLTIGDIVQFSAEGPGYELSRQYGLLSFRPIEPLNLKQYDSGKLIEVTFHQAQPGRNIGSFIPTTSTCFFFPQEGKLMDLNLED